MSAIKCGALVLLGGAIGSVTTFFVMKKKVDEAKAETDEAYGRGFNSAREAYYNQKMQEWTDNPEKFDENNNDISQEESADTIMSKYRPDNLEDEGENNDDEFDTPYISYKEPYEITYEEYATNGYEERELVYYANDVLTEVTLENVGTEFENEYEEEVDNVAELIGVDSLASFENSEEDEIYVRNDVLKVDFRIARSLKTYASKQKKKKSTPNKEE